MAKYIVLEPVTIRHMQSGQFDDYEVGRIIDLEDYTAAILLERKCIQPAATKQNRGIISMKELRHDTDN